MDKYLIIWYHVTPVSIIAYLKGIASSLYLQIKERMIAETKCILCSGVELCG